MEIVTLANDCVLALNINTEIRTVQLIGVRNTKLVKGQLNLLVGTHEGGRQPRLHSFFSCDPERSRRK